MKSSVCDGAVKLVRSMQLHHSVGLVDERGGCAWDTGAFAHDHRGVTLSSEWYPAVQMRILVKPRMRL